MKKETTFLKLFTLLVLSCLSFSYAWADSHTICFDRKDFISIISNDNMPFTKSYLNTDQGSMPNGTEWTPLGDAFEYSDLGTEHYWGYVTKGKKWRITLENFKYQVTNISLFADDANHKEMKMGQLTIVPSIVPDGTDAQHVNEITNQANTASSLVSQEFADTYTWSGLNYIEYEQLYTNMCYFRSSPYFLGITYQDPTISYDENSKTLGVGMSYAIDKSEIVWGYQGAFTTDDIKFNTGDASVATVDANGVITATGVGTTTITAKVINTLNNKDYDVNGASFSITITVPNIYTENGKTIAAGSWTSDALQTSLNSEVKSNSTVVDLTNATISDGTVTVPTTNPNVLIKAKEGQVTNTTNVLIEDESGNLVCNLLRLQDGTRFSVAEAFKATATEYVRENTDTWGAICLPYAPVPTTTTKYYALTGVGSSSLTFTTVDEPQANTPYLYKNTTGENYSGSINSTTDVLVTPTTMETSITGYKMCGAFNPTSVVDGTNFNDSKNSNYDCITDANAYYFKNNQFNIQSGRFNMGGFRAYLTPTTNGTKASSLSIDFDELATNAKFIENVEKGTVEVIFDTNGRQLHTPQKGINIINGKKVLVK